MNIKQLQQKRIAEVAALKALHVKAEGRDMTEEEQAAWATQKAVVENLDKAITRELEMLAVERSQSTIVEVPQTTTTASSGVVVSLDAGDRPFRSFGEQLSAIYQAGIPGGRAAQRLYGVQAAASGASATVGSDGGFLVQHDFSADLFKRAYETGILASRCMPIEISANSNGVEAPFIDETSRANGSRWGGVQVYRRGESDTVTATRPKIGKWQLELEDMMAIAYATDRSLEDASALGQIFSEAFSDEFAFKLDDEIVRGNGAGQCLGIINSGCVVTTAKEASQTADTVNANNIVKMWARMWPRSKANAVWLINPELMEQLPLMTLGTGTVNMLFMPPGGLTTAMFGTLFGRPVIEVEQCSGIGDLGDIILADLSQYVLARKGGLKADQSMHVRFLYTEQAFRWVTRVNGQPKWKSALTPYKGTKTLSPFVMLEAR